MPKKILIIEDDDMLRGLITQRLTKEDYKISQAIDGISGLKAIREEKPDLVLLDIILPGMNGFEVLENAKKDPIISGIPIAILSNLSQQEDKDKALGLGAVDYFIKVNFTSEEILEKIKSILR
jgi:DNA-binding response OmpR family regulator